MLYYPLFDGKPNGEKPPAGTDDAGSDKEAKEGEKNGDKK